MNKTYRNTLEWQTADVTNYLHPFTDYKELAVEKAVIIERGEGCYVWDIDGNQYLDAMSGLACVNLGFGEQRLVEAAGRQMQSLAYFNSFFKFSNKPSIELAEKLVELTPSGLNHVFYVNDGSEANDTAIRMARHYWALQGKPEKQVLIAREYGYHGSTIASASLSGMPMMHNQAASLPDFAHIPTAYQFMEGRGLNEEEYGLKAASFLEEKINEIGPEKVAAFVAEPLHGAGGAKMPPRNYWGEIQRICKQYDVLLVVDEVVSGFGRTGAWFGSETYGIENIDLMCLAKGITSGYVPLGAVMLSNRMAETFIDKGGEFFHGFTYSGHPVACAVALENIALIEEKQLVERIAEDTGPYLERRMGELLDHPLVGEVRTCGLIGAVELVRDQKTLAPLEPAGEVGELFKPIAMKYGIITRPVGETIIMMPPLVITREEIDLLVDRFSLALNDFQEEIIIEQAS